MYRKILVALENSRADKSLLPHVWVIGADGGEEKRVTSPDNFSDTAALGVRAQLKGTARGVQISGDANQMLAGTHDPAGKTSKQKCQRLFFGLPIGKGDRYHGLELSPI